MMPSTRKITTRIGMMSTETLPCDPSANGFAPSMSSGVRSRQETAANYLHGRPEVSLLHQDGAKILTVFCEWLAGLHRKPFAEPDLKPLFVVPIGVAANRIPVLPVQVEVW